MLGDLGRILGRLADSCSPQATRVMLAMIAEADTTGTWRGTAIGLGKRLGVSRYTVAAAQGELAQRGHTTRNPDRSVQIVAPAPQNPPACGAGATANVREDRRCGAGATLSHDIERTGVPARRAGKTSPSSISAQTLNYHHHQQPGGGGGIEEDRANQLLLALVKAGVQKPAALRVVSNVPIDLADAIFAEWRGQQSGKKPPSIQLLAWRLKQLLNPASDTARHAVDLVQQRAERERRAAQTRAKPQAPQVNTLSTGDDADRADLAALTPDQVATLCAAMDQHTLCRAAAPHTPENFTSTPGRVMRAAIVLRELRAAGTLPAADSVSSHTREIVDEH